MAEYTITKRYGRKLTRDYSSWDFMTEASKTVNVNSAEELEAESTKLFEQVKVLTDIDIQNNMNEIQPKDGK